MMPPGLSKAKIVAAAMELLKTGGLATVSMRNIAARLGVKAASLYRHISGKEELLSEMAEAVIEGCRPDTIRGSHEEVLVELLSRYRRCLKQVRDSVKVMQSTPPTTPIRRVCIEMVSGAVRGLGVPEDDVFICGHLLNNYVLSFVDDEDRLAGSGLDMDREFRKGLDILLSGIRQRGAP